MYCLMLRAMISVQANYSGSYPETLLDSELRIYNILCYNNYTIATRSTALRGAALSIAACC